MPLRCLLFSSDLETAEPIRQVLSGLGVEGEYCSDATAAIEKVGQQSFQIVIIDWDQQPEAGLLLNTARQRKAAERPLTLAIVSQDVSVPQALQAGANSILRKPLQGNQVNDVLTTARDLLRAKQESAASVAQAAAAGTSASASTTVAASPGEPKQRPQPAGELFQFSLSAPAPQFVNKSNTPVPSEWSSPEPLGSRNNLQPLTTSQATEYPVPSSSEPTSMIPQEKPRGLEWYLKTRAGASSTIPAEAPFPPVSEKPELVGFDQATSRSALPRAHSDDTSAGFAPDSKPKQVRSESKPTPPPVQEGKKEAELFAYMAGEKSASNDSSQPKSRLGKGAIIGALLLAAGAILAAPQAPWHPKMRGVFARAQQATRGWLNPQPVTPTQAPVAHEDFGRAGDEYKMPASETIPDATTDPSQIQVVPVVDPTAKKPISDGQNPGQPAGQPEGTGAVPGEQNPPPAVQIQEKPPAPASGTAETPTTPAPAPTSSSTIPPAPTAPLRPDSTVAIRPTPPAAPRNQTPRNASTAGNVPTSLKSQLASMTPESSGNKAPEAALPSIEPVAVSEAIERALLTDQAAVAYPPSARGQQGTVILQILIGRDGAVQDAKFLQGSLAFARAAIDGVKQWQFKPYMMNGRPVSVQTSLTVTFKPAS